MKQPDPTSDPPMVFIAGCPRSGTTWTARMFEDHTQTILTHEAALFSCLLKPWWMYLEIPPDPDLVPPPEPGLKDRCLDLLEKLLVRPRGPWHDEWRETLVSYFTERLPFILSHSKLWKKTTDFSELRGRLVTYDRLCEFIDEAEQVGYATHEEKVVHVARAIYQQFFARHDGGAEHVLVDKTPGNLMQADFIFDHFPGARMIEVVRDGRDVCVSMDSYKAYMPKKRAIQIAMWKMFAEKGLELKRNSAYEGRILEVRYEELRRDTVGELSRMFDFAGFEATADQAREIVEGRDIRKVAVTGEGQHVRKGVVGDWQRRLDPHGVELFRQRAGEIFHQLGYRW